jgi:2-polyprenyl-6-methoxyphenol hydroxylase-like FAD-dependent oxidoreductase
MICDGTENIVFIGDASHGCSPLLQQGTAQALEDAVTLSIMLTKFNDINEILHHYENIRRPRAEWVIQNSDIPIKQISSYINDEDYKKRNQLIQENDPLNIQKWKILFMKKYFNLINNYINHLQYKKHNKTIAKL